MGSIVSTMTIIYAGRSGFQILAGTRELSLLQNNQTSSSTHPASISMKTRALSLAVKVASEYNLTTHIHLEPSLKISGTNLHSTCFPP